MAFKTLSAWRAGAGPLACISVGLLVAAPDWSQPSATAAVSRTQDLAPAPEWSSTDLGNPPHPGSTVKVPSGLDVTGNGADLGGTSDQGHFAWQETQGNFDLQTRVAGVTISDPFVIAGLMARESLTANARFGGVFTSSPQLGSFARFRTTAGSSADTVSPPLGMPANYPYLWLRLRRTDNLLAGYASVDGATWVALAERTFSGLPVTLFVGMAVSSINTNLTATAQFREPGPTVSKAIGSFRATREPLGPCSRATGLVFSELMYHPPKRPDGRDLEYLEIYNARAVGEDLTGWRLSGDIEYRFPDGFRLEAGDFVVVAASPGDVTAVYGITNVLGPYSGRLPAPAGHIRLHNGAGAVRLDLSYRADPPWPVAPDGTGHSLLLARASYGENDPRAWSASEQVGGTPGRPEAYVPYPEADIVINEFLAHTDDPVLDFIELYNHGNTAVDLSGAWLSDHPATNKFRLPADSRIPARGFLVVDQSQLGFRLDAAGEALYLWNSNATRVIDAIRFGAQENGVSSGRSPDGAPTVRRLSRPTPGSPNASERPEPIVINEIMYNPISGDSDDEYLELYNRSSGPVELGGWQLTDGVEYTFAPGTRLAAGGYMVVARNVERLRTRYSQLSLANSVGNYSGSLANSGERIALAKPHALVATNKLGQVETNLVHIVVTDVTYGTGGRWGDWSDGGGSSLELIDPDADPRLAGNWADSDESRKAAWSNVSLTGKLELGNSGSPANRLHLGMLGAGECQVDDIEIFRVGSTNVLPTGDFESALTGWSLNGNHSLSSVVTDGAAAGNHCLQIRAQGDGDTGINSIRAPLRTTLASGSTVTLNAKVRWTAGWPQLLFRLRGNFFEFPVNLPLPASLGTPGQPNSRLVANAGPVIHEVAHDPPLPRAGAEVVVTCRVSDPDGVAQVVLDYRVDPSTTLRRVSLRDDGVAPDSVAGDGLFAGKIPSPTGGTLVAFRITATDDAGSPSSSVFPARAPEQECLIRWNDPIPFGTFAHYHLWSTAATENLRQQKGALDNTWRDATLVYGNFRALYNVGFRDKGSPYHGGSGDFAVSVPADDLLLGTRDRVFASTGNGGSEATGIRSQLAAWLGQQLGIPYLHAHYLRLYRNGTQFREVMEDLEQPSHAFAERWFPGAPEGDLYKVAVWFEFQDDNYNFNATSATIERFVSNGAYKLPRYRWNFQRRSNDGDANRYTNLFDLATALNDTSANYVNGVQDLIDAEQWMRVYMFDFMMGNWDAWSYNVGQNMYLYKPAGQRWVMMPWDIDFVFGLGDGTSGTLWGGQDPVINRLYSGYPFQRMMWRAYQDAVNGPYLAQNYQPQIDARRRALLKNGITSLQNPSSISSYLEGRRRFIVSRLAATDAKEFALTSNSGNDFVSPTPTATLEGTAPFAVATLEINGVPYPHTWISATKYRVVVPLTQVTNPLTLVGKDRLGQVVSGATDSITVTYRGPIETPDRFVVINEVHYHPAEPSASFLEIFNRSTTTPFDLSGFGVEGVGYTFPPGSIIQPNSYLLLVKNRTGFANAYGAGLPVFAEFPGSLDNDGEHVALVQPGATGEEGRRLSDLRYSDQAPWPTNAAGLGSSLQLIDPALDTYRVANWLATATNDVNRVTPGRVNAGRQTLPAFPSVWLNEVMPQNLSGPRDNAGDLDPWIELYNAGTEWVDLGSCYLTGDFGQLTRWKFPAGTAIGPSQWLLVWADGEPDETAPGALHTDFRLAPQSGGVALTRLQGTPSAPAVLDYLGYELLTADRSYGSYPDGEPRQRRAFPYPTPRAANNPGWPAIHVTINEFMASNTRTLLSPLTRQYEDWFELYNAGSTAVDLAGYFLTDNLTHQNKFEIPAGTVIPAGGFLLVWADEESRANQPGRDLHTNFKLAAAGEELGLFAPDLAPIDTFTFSAQTNDVSMGRYPDGADLPLLALDGATPGEPNYLAGGNRPPVFTTNPFPDQTVAEGSRWTAPIAAVDPDPGQTVTYSLGQGSPADAAVDATTGELVWIPSESDGPGTQVLVVRATDNGTPPRTATLRVVVHVTEVNEAPSFQPIAEQTVNEGDLLIVPLAASDPDLPPNRLTYRLLPGAPEGVSLEIAESETRLTWVPSESQGPATYDLQVEVFDDGLPVLQGQVTVQVTVREVNNPPVIADIPPQAAEEFRPFTYPVAAWDPDAERSPILYSLDLAPPTASIDPASGLIRWTPTESDGPSNAIFIVRATETRPPNLTSSRTFSVQVNEVNLPPTLALLPNLQVAEGETLAIRAQGSDPDWPPQSLTYSLAPGSPDGLRIEAATGWLTWEMDSDQGPSTNHVTVRVTDDGPGSLSGETSFWVIVVPQPHAVITEIMYHPKTPRTEFIEIANNSGHSRVDLSNVVLSGTDLTFAFRPGTVLAPGQHTVVVRDPAAFETAYGTGLPVSGTYQGTLQPTGDTLRLVRSTPAGSAVLNEVQFGTRPPWPAAADGTGPSLQVIDERQDNHRVGNWAATALGPAQSTLLVALTHVWRYNQEGVDLGTAWREPAYADSSWPSGPGLLYNEGADLPGPKNTPLTLGPTTFYFRTHFNLVGSPTGLSLQLYTVLDDAAVIYLNGKRLFDLGMDPGVEITYDTFSARTVGDATLEGPFPLPSADLKSGDNVLAVEVHQINATSSDIVFGLTLEAQGSAAPYTPGLANSVATSLPPYPPLSLNEVYAKPSAQFLDNVGEPAPWFELFNAGPQAIGLEGWYLSDSATDLARWAFPAGSLIRGGEFLVLWGDGEPSESQPGALHPGFSLQAAGGRLVLSRTQLGQAAPVDYLDYPAGSEGRSYGSLPDGQSFARASLEPPTPQGPNRAVPAPVIQASQVRADGSVWFSWETLPGLTYRVESQDRLGTGKWEVVVQTVAQSDRLSFVDQPAQHSGSRYYRVVAAD